MFSETGKVFVITSLFIQLFTVNAAPAKTGWLSSDNVKGEIKWTANLKIVKNKNKLFILIIMYG